MIGYFKKTDFHTKTICHALFATLILIFPLWGNKFIFIPSFILVCYMMISGNIALIEKIKARELWRKDNRLSACLLIYSLILYYIYLVLAIFIIVSYIIVQTYPDSFT